MEHEEVMRLAGKSIELTYQCRDTGYGPEPDFIEGKFTSEVDHAGRFTFQSNEGAVMCLFPDEVVEVCEFHD